MYSHFLCQSSCTKIAVRHPTQEEAMGAVFDKSEQLIPANHPFCGYRLYIDTKEPDTVMQHESTIRRTTAPALWKYMIKTMVGGNCRNSAIPTGAPLHRDLNCVGTTIPRILRSKNYRSPPLEERRNGLLNCQYVLWCLGLMLNWLECCYFMT